MSNEDDFLDIDGLTALINEDEAEDEAKLERDNNDASAPGAKELSRAPAEDDGHGTTDVDGDNLEDLAALMEEDGDFDEEEATSLGVEKRAGGDDDDDGVANRQTEEAAEESSGIVEEEEEEAAKEGGDNDESQEELMEELLAMQRKMEALKKKLSGTKSPGDNKTAMAPSGVSVQAEGDKKTTKNDATVGSSSSAPSPSTAAPSPSTAPSPFTAPFPSPAPSSSSSKKSSFCSYMKGLDSDDVKRPKERRVATPHNKAKSVAVEAQIAKKLDQVKAKLNPDSPRGRGSMKPSTTTTTPSNGSPVLNPKNPVSASLPSTGNASNASRAQMSKDLFGDDFDDDDEDPDHKNSLNPYGALVQNSLNKERDKVSDLRREKEVDRSAFHSRGGSAAATPTSAPTPTPTTTPQPPPSKNTLSAPVARPPSSASSSSQSSSTTTSSSAVETESLTGIRIKNPRVSIFGLQQKLKSKRLLRLSKIRGAIRNGVIEGEWSSLAVIVTKGEPRTSSNGNSFSVWTLSDLDDCDLKVSLFLFGETFKSHWKTSRGSVVGVVNATVMPPRDKKEFASEIALTVDQPQKLLLVGDSQDLGSCRATKKNGEKCTSFVNLSKSEYCSFHVQKAYHKIGSKRGELQSAMTGHAPKNFEKAQLAKKILGGGNEFYFGGKTFTSESLPMFNNNNKSKKDQKTDLEKLASLNQLPGGSVAAFKDGIQTNLAAHHNVSNRLAAAVTTGLKGGKDFHERMTKPTAGSKILLAHLVEKEEVERKKTVVPKTAKALLKEETKSQRTSKSSSQSSSQSSQSNDGLDIEFSFSPTSRLNPKAAAIAKVKAVGGIKKENPNAVKQARLEKISDAKSRDSLKRRLSSSGGESGSDEIRATSSSPAASAVAAKKRKIIDIDLNSPEAQQLLKAKSSHSGALAEQRAEEEESYFAALEKKEAMAEQMQKITKVKCKVVTCKVCKYTAISASEECRKEHPQHLVFKQGSKGFFNCGKCGKRTVALGIMPDKPCKNCGEMKWARCSMLKEKAGPVLENEILMLRGEESGFIGAEGGANKAMKLLQQKRKGTAISTGEKD